MINVTVGEQKTQSEKPFPKLMRVYGESGWIGYFIRHGVCTWLTGNYAGQSTSDVNMSDIFDYNEPITLQNI